jgi:sugar phosphate isomerase/epimerase
MERPLGDTLAVLAERTRHVEIFSDGLHSLLAAHAACGEYPFSYSVHAPAADINIAAVNERMRSASVDVLADTLAICCRIGAAHLVVHPGFFAFDQMQDRSFAALLRSLDDLVPLQEEHGVAVCLENMGSWQCCHFRTPGLIPEIADRGLAWTLDCGHAQLNGNLGEFLAQGTFRHVHLHDNCGKSDDHIACGDGTIDFFTLVRLLPAGATLVAETKDLSAADRSVSYLTGIMNGERYHGPS